jgi:pimeloyl-ACP methyl ester carboxylesterase
MARNMFQRQKAMASAAKFLWPIWDKGLRKRIHRISAPTLIVWGDHDGIVPTAYAEEFHKAIRGSQMQIIKDTAHFEMIEKPEEFDRVVKAFLKS